MRKVSKSHSVFRSAAVIFLLSVLGPAALRAVEGCPKGFTRLFNGQDLAGWKGLVADPPKRAQMSPDELAKAQAAADQQMRDHWKVENGVLVYDGKGNSLCTLKDYADFDLLVDWKIEKGGDSGIYLRGSPQVQIWDNEVGSGGLYNNQKNPSKPLAKADKPVGEWNSFQIKMVGDRVTVHLNGVLVVDNVLMENYWERDKPIYPAGQIELQHHESPLHFRNICLREIPRGTESAASSRPVLKVGARVAITGDSITEQKLYCRYMEDYLLACVPHLELRVVQLGWSGERAPGFAERMDNDLLPFKPDVVTTCYGMNDGQYRAYEPSIGQPYEKAMRDIVRRVKAKGGSVVVGSPGAVDTFSFRNPNTSPKVYNDNLSHLRDIARSIAADEGMPFANVHDAMVSAMEKAKESLGEAYDVCGADGFHPQPNGHIVMAYAFLKGLGLGGEIGTITADMKGEAKASEGHKILSAAGGKIEVESRRYPFCFYGDTKSPAATRSIVPFLPFQSELNRFLLVVKNLPSSSAKVTWGSSSKSFSREDLSRGINLAAEFLDNPFSEPFKKVDDLVAKKQAFETPMIKEIITRFRKAQELLGEDPQAWGALETIRARLFAKDNQLHEEVVKAITPVRHTIVVEAE
jgi:lysophospholipase L1-like esterase